MASKETSGLGKEGRHKRMDRRRFLKSTAAAAAGAAAVSRVTPALGEGGRRTERIVDYPVLVVAVGPDRSLLLERRSGLTVEIQDPKGTETWQSGDEAVVEERLVNGVWKVSDVTRMYRPIEAEKVKSRHGQVLSTSGEAAIDFDSETQPRGDADQGYAKVPLQDVGAGDVVGGLAYLDPRTGNQIAALVGVRRRPS